MVFALNICFARWTFEFMRSHHVQGSVRVANIAEFGPARRGGLEVGDLVLEVNGVPVFTRPLKDLMTLVRGRAGSPVALVTCLVLWLVVDL